MDLEQEIWGYTDNADMVGVPVFIFTVHRGATLLGAFEPSGRMVGFAYAVVGMKAGGRCCGRTWPACCLSIAAASAIASSWSSARAPSRRATT